MTLPTLTREQRIEALNKASESRAVRAKFKQEVANKELTALDAFNTALDDDILNRMRAEEFLRSLPSIGAKTATRIMEELQITPSRRLRGLGPRQVNRLREYCTGIQNRR